jgi:hypothetical protein
MSILDEVVMFLKLWRNWLENAVVSFLLIPSGEMIFSRTFVRMPEEARAMPDASEPVRTTDGGYTVT